MTTLNLSSTEDTIKLGKALGLKLSSYFTENKSLPIKLICLHGELGSGKTTLTRSFVHTLPQGNLAEVSSPSFTICNTYATKPEVLHVDLYRCEQNIPQELWEELDIDDSLIIIEWADFLPNDAFPENFLDIYIKICEQGRSVLITAHGTKAEFFLKNLALDTVTL